MLDWVSVGILLLKDSEVSKFYEVIPGIFK